VFGVKNDLFLEMKELNIAILNFYKTQYRIFRNVTLSSQMGDMYVGLLLDCTFLNRLTVKKNIYKKNTHKHTTHALSLTGQRHRRYSSETKSFYQKYLAMRNTADVTGGNCPSPSVRSLSQPLVAFYNIHGRKRELFF
jgi:hypothetical protein